MSKKRKTPKEAEEIMNPLAKSRYIVDFLTNNEYIGTKLHTAICHGLENFELEELYERVLEEEKNKGQI